MLVVAVLREPGDDVALRPVNLKGVAVLIVDVILQFEVSATDNWSRCVYLTHVNGHLINVNAFLDPELRDDDIESGVQDTDDFSLSHDGSMSLSKVGNEQAKEQVSGLFLGKLRGIPLTATEKWII
jgi:hypothetical protein